MGSTLERFASQFLELSSNPKGNSAYKLFSTMLEEKEFVTDNAICLNVTSTHDLEQLSNILDLHDCSRIGIFYKKNKVTASCRFKGIRFGASGANVIETFTQLKQKVEYYRNTNEVLII